MADSLNDCSNKSEDIQRRTPEWIEHRDDVQSVLRKGCDATHPRAGGFRGYFTSIAEIVPLQEKLGFETIALAAVEPAISAHDESYNDLGGVQQELWLDLLFDISADESIVGASRHLLYVGRKR